jgi:phosphoglucosamine mutase
MAIDELDFNVRRTRVGDTYVSEELKTGGEFGGEPSGCWVFPHISLCPDGIYAAAQIVTIASRQRLSQLVDSIPAYPLLRDSISSRGIETSSLEQQLKALAPLSINNTDGIRLNFEDGWVLIRASGTEPKIRLTAEARDKARARQMYDDSCKIIKDCIKGRKV